MARESHSNTEDPLHEAERLVAATAMTLRGMVLQIDLLWESLQSPADLDAGDARAFTWALRELARGAVERLEEANDLLDDADDERGRAPAAHGPALKP